MNMNFFSLETEVSIKIAEKAKAKRKYMKLTQQQLSDKSGVSLGSLKRFERTGEISLSSLLKIALVLDSLKELENSVGIYFHRGDSKKNRNRIEVYIGAVYG
ncbi:MAG: helix-turn-helix transcriptional regulator [Clostridia bacterium]